MDPLAPSITFFDKETGKGRITYIGAFRMLPRRSRTGAAGDPRGPGAGVPEACGSLSYGEGGARQSTRLDRRRPRLEPLTLCPRCHAPSPRPSPRVFIFPSSH